MALHRLGECSGQSTAAALRPMWRYQWLCTALESAATAPLVGRRSPVGRINGSAPLWRVQLVPLALARSRLARGSMALHRLGECSMRTSASRACQPGASMALHRLGECSDAAAAHRARRRRGHQLLCTALESAASAVRGFVAGPTGASMALHRLGECSRVAIRDLVRQYGSYQWLCTALKSAARAAPRPRRRRRALQWLCTALKSAAPVPGAVASTATSINGSAPP